MSKIHKYKFIPQNYTTEEILLGIIIIYPQTFNIIKNIIKKEYFFLETHQIIYLSFKQINKQNKKNTIELLFKLQDNKLLSKIGGTATIIKIMKKGQIFISSQKAHNQIENLIKILQENYTKRLVIQLGYNMIHMGHVINVNSKKLYSKILSHIYLIEKQINDHKDVRIVNIKEIISKKLIEIKYSQIYSINKIKRITIKSGFFELDNIITSLPKSNLIIIAGRPSIGKTSLAINIAYNVFFYQNSSLLIFSLEMSKDEVFNKLISIASEININNKTINKLNKEQWKKISKICNKLLNNNIYINDTNNIDINYLDSVTTTIKKDENINLVIIDYLQLIEFSSEKQKKYSRSQELGYITRKLKLIAQFLELPVIVISQLNRNIEIRSNKEPLLSDLKESGCIKSKNNITIKSKYANEINIKNINNDYEKIRCKKLNNVKRQRIFIIKNKTRRQDKSGYINIFNKYIFKYINNTLILLTTHNHQYLSQNAWIESNKILISTTINYKKKDKKFFIYKKYINTIIYNQYSKSYDINQNNYFNIISKEIVTHNSIEQDADIIISLYEKEETKKDYNSDNKKIINLKVSKNRNGNTGYCKLTFIPGTSTFKSINRS
uniref:DNA 5'-3' helicase n=1 Tax=Polysiphonia sp. TaxID=1967842 RepID=A0A1Z1M3L4_9FLOR|nr:Replication helicase subunit [Polysiphonia sp.]